jgi:hypothetical protein
MQSSNLAVAGALRLSVTKRRAFINAMIDSLVSVSGGALHVGIGVALGLGVALGIGVLVGVSTRVGVLVWVGVPTGVRVGVFVLVGVGTLAV